MGEVVPFLISKGVEVSARGDDGSAVEVICSDGPDEVLRILIGAGAKFDTKSLKEQIGPFAEYPLQLAAKSQKDAAGKVKLLIDHGVDANSLGRRDKEEHALHAAVMVGNTDAVMVLLDNGVDVDVCVTPHGTSLSRFLNECSWDEPDLENSVVLKTVRCLLDAGANPNAEVEADGGTAFLLAIAYGNAELVRMFVEAGADLQGQRQSHWNPLNLARYYLIMQALGMKLGGDGYT